MSYRAGAAYIQVSPSFRGFQLKAAAEAKKMRPIKVPVVFDTDGQDPVVKRPRKPVTVPVQLEVRGGKFERDLQTKVRAARAALGDIEIGVATTEAEQKLRDLQVKLAELNEKRIGVDLSAEEAMAEARALQIEIARLGASSPNIQVRSDAAAAAAELAGVATLAGKVGAQDPTVNVDADTGAAHSKLTALEARLKAMAGRTTLLKVGMMASPLAIPAAGLAGGALGGLMGIGAGLAAGVGGAAVTGLLALKQAKDAQKKLTTATDGQQAAVRGVQSAQDSLASATHSANQAALSGARAVADAERALADARRNAARSVEAAEQRLVDTQDAVRESLRDLNAARQQAARDLDELTARVKANANAEESANLTLGAARARLADLETNVFASSEDMRRARLDVAEAEDKVAQARRDATRDADQLAKVEAGGLDATDGVRAAKKRVADARDDQARARLELIRARADAARAVGDAERNLAQARVDAARQVATAERNLARARADAASANAEAQRGVASAQRDLAAAQREVTTAETARSAALAKLTPGQERMLAGLAALQGAWHKMLRTIDRPLSGAMVAGMEALQKALPGLALFLRPVLRGLRGVFDLFGNAAASKGARRFARDFGQFSGSIIRDAGRGTRNVVAGFGSLLRAFMPLSRDMSKGLVGLTRGFRKWAAGLSTSNGFQKFITWVRTNGPVFLVMLKQIGVALVKVAVALAPLAMAMVRGITVFATWLAKTAEAHPTLIRIAAVIGLAAAAFTTLAGWLAPVIGLFGSLISGLGLLWKIGRIVIFNLRILFFVLRANPIGMVITVVFLLGAALVVAYKKSEKFRRIVNGAWDGIKKAISWAWNRVIKPVLKAYWLYITKVLVPVIVWLWKNVVRPVFGWIGGKIRDTWKLVVKPALKALRDFLFERVIPGIRVLWRDVVKPVFTQVGDKIHNVWVNVIKPAFLALRDGVGKVRSAFRTAVDAIGKIWAELKAAAGKPVKFVIDSVYNNGIRKVVNAIPGVGDLPEANVPAGLLRLARGGPVFGGTPGKDSVPALLMPNEHVWTAKEVARAGGHKVMRALRTAILRGDPLGALGAGLQRFAGGGAVWPTTGHIVSTYKGHDGVDINGPGQDYGNPIYAWRTGKISYVGWGRGYGQAIFEQAPGFPEVVYGHTSRTFVQAGQQVRAGDTIGLVGSTGHSTGPHLHFGVPNGTYAGALALLNGAATAKGGGGGGLPNPFALIKKLKNLWGSVTGSLGQLTKMGGWGGMMRQMAGSLVGGLRGWVNDKVPGPGPIPKLFDNGGMLRYGDIAYHGATKPDRVLTDAQWSSMHQLAARGAGAPGAPGGRVGFDLYDANGQLMARMEGIARSAVNGHNEFAAARKSAGMSR